MTFLCIVFDHIDHCFITNGNKKGSFKGTKMGDEIIYLIIYE